MKGLIRLFVCMVFMVMLVVMLDSAVIIDARGCTVYLFIVVCLSERALFVGHSGPFHSVLIFNIHHNI